MRFDSVMGEYPIWKLEPIHQYSIDKVIGNGGNGKLDSGIGRVYVVFRQILLIITRKSEMHRGDLHMSIGVMRE